MRNVTDRYIRHNEVRYIRHNEVLGRGSCKSVYRAFDRAEGIEVAWNQVDLLQSGFDPSDQWNDHIQKLKSEVQLLRHLHHKNIMRCYDAWFDDYHKTMIFITELCTSGSLREYMERNGPVEQKVIRSWASQILQGLVYLHGQKPPIAHRDLKCDNIFINGNTGELKIGDLGLACFMQADKNVKRSILGTPEYMAPELLQGNYSELVDVYAFGMCVLEMLTLEYPYQECGNNMATTFLTISGGKKPQALRSVSDPAARDLIKKCLEPVDRRPSAASLLDHQFFKKSEFTEAPTDRSVLKNPIEETRDVGAELKSAAPKGRRFPPPDRRRSDWVFLGAEASYREHPLMADKFGMPGQAGRVEGFDMGEIEGKFRGIDVGEIERKFEQLNREMMGPREKYIDRKYRWDNPLRP